MGDKAQSFRNRFVSCGDPCINVAVVAVVAYVFGAEIGKLPVKKLCQIVLLCSAWGRACGLVGLSVYFNVSEKSFKNSN